MLTGTPQGMMQAMELLEKAYHHAPDYHNVITNLAYMKFRFTQSIESSRQLFIDATRKFPQKSEVFVMYAQVSPSLNPLSYDPLSVNPTSL